jgi:hypothetical protein
MANDKPNETGDELHVEDSAELTKDEKKALKKLRKEEKALAKAEAKAKAKEENPERGIETMFRTTAKNHMQLSQIADNKANIMLSINALILSISVTGLLPQMGLHPEVRLPLFLLLAVCLGSMVFATISTIPKLSKGITTREECDRKEGNLLFFGNFHAMKRTQYEMAMNELMNDRSYLYGSLVRDLYYLGVVLHRKYALLRISYMIFMYGMIGVVALSVWAVETAGHVH